jgi:hypothetical protein
MRLPLVAIHSNRYLIGRRSEGHRRAFDELAATGGA